MDRVHPVYAAHGMVASQEALATQVGVDILKQGGNAVDAAVAVGFALAVTLPQAGNLGGGGFMIVHLAESGETIAIDYREKAPDAASRDMFLDAAGEADPQLSRFSGLAVGVPGTVAGLTLALERYGTMELAEVIAPATCFGRGGHLVTPDLAQSLEASREELEKYASSAAIFFRPDGSAFEPGDRLVQSDLAGVAPAPSPRAAPTRSTGARSAPHRRRDGALGRPDHGGRPRRLRGGAARAGARRLSRLRGDLDAAAVVRRRAHHPDPEHPGRLSDR